MGIIEEIQSRNDRFGQAADRGDAEALARLYTDGAWLLPPGAPMVRGRAEIEVFWKSRLERIVGIKLTTLDVAPLGPDGAREIGESSIVLKGQPDPILGKYVVVWKRVDGMWHLEADAFNANG
jgi:uncharacterized protein (TIGR02246 family)